ncbi:MAG: twin-arginine translocation signal domain-containing protein [Selenomonadaceae bacterium]|nr:twin-arginine translocation signal domain-containing protein [Selenomonadaceae bacterium]
MDINRRDFFKLAGAAAVAAVGSMGRRIVFVNVLKRD